MNRLILTLFALLLPGMPLAENVGEELLEPDKAFRLEVSVKNSETIVARWTIADGYYMYKAKFIIVTDTPGYRLGTVSLPDGEIKHDEFFGDVEIYRKAVALEIPIIPQPNASPNITLRTVSQGCADIGVCYPPSTKLTALTLPTKPQQALKIKNPLEALSNLARDVGNDGADEFLEPDKAFVFTIDVKDANTLVAHWQVADDYYLYRDKIKFSLPEKDGVELGQVSLIKGKVKNDEFFGQVEIYEGIIDIPVPLERTNTAKTAITIETTYQGCANAGLCYPPITKAVSLTLPASDDASLARIDRPPSSPSETALAPLTDMSSAQIAETFQSEQDRIAQTLASGATWLVVISFFGFGLLLAFTPCVFPMIPILSGIIIGHGKSMTTGKAFSLSMVYVLAMAATYTIAGILVGLSGENVQVWFQNPWVLSTFAGVFVLLSLSMFGFYELQMPTAIQTRLTQISNSQEGGTMVGAAIMGFLSALIVGPCVTAPLIGALIYIANTGDAVLGGLALFALSLGMGAPLLIIGTSAGKLLPKVGSWMDTVKAVFGILLLGVGIWLLERILPIEVIMALTGVLLVISAIYMGALEAIKPGGSGWFRLWKGLGLVIFIYGTVLLLGAAAGSNSILQPLKGILVADSSMVNRHGLEFKQIKGVADLQTALANAQQQRKPLMLDFYADWCVSCKEMEAYTFTDERVQTALKDVILIQADVTKNDDPDKQLLKKLGLFGPPAILFFTPDGLERRPYRVVGFMSAEKFSQHVKMALGKGTAL